MELRGFSGLNGNYIVLSETIHDKYELSLTGVGVIWFFRELSLKKMKIRGYSGKMLKKWSYSVFLWFKTTSVLW